MRSWTIPAVIAMLAGAAAADPPKAALGVPSGGAEPTLRAAWKIWIKTAAWTEASAPAAAVVTACVAIDPACAAGVAALHADRTWIVSLDPPATPGAEPFVTGRVYDGAGALITSSQRSCARCATNRANLTTEVGKLLDGLRDSVERLTTRLVIELDTPGVPVLLDGAPIEPSAAGQAVAAGPHTLAIAGGGCWEMAPVSAMVASGETVHARLPVTVRAPHLQIRVQPAGATVAIDGVAATGAEVESTPGSHHVTAAKDGWQAASADVTLAGCESKDVALVLWHRGSRGRTPLLFAVGGGVAIGAGLALVIADRDQVNGSNRSATYRDSAPLGTAIAVVGAASVGVAIYLWHREPPLVPAIAPVEGGAVGVAAWEF